MNGYKKVPDQSVVTAWKKNCNCRVDDGLKLLHPCDIALTGIPVCPECGADYEYECVWIEL